MIELLVVIAIATIGVVYTSSTGEAESTAMADKSAKDALDEAEGQSGIGILGIDVVARKMRAAVGLRDGAVSAETIAEYRADEDRPRALEASSTDWNDWDEDAELAAAEDEDWGDAFDAEDMPNAEHAVIRNVAAALGAGDAEEDDLTMDGLAMDDPAETVAAAPEQEIAQADEASEAESWLRDAEEDRRSAAAAHAPVSGIDTRDAPVVEDFDPAQDQILIGYRPGEAGNGRIGIMEDPLHPGSAAVTLGGRCVAVVLDGFGKVRAHHIELVCDDDEDDLAA